VVKDSGVEPLLDRSNFHFGFLHLGAGLALIVPVSVWYSAWKVLAVIHSGKKLANTKE
jgi:hypothetical protein